jgi:hypothetical protein
VKRTLVVCALLLPFLSSACFANYISFKWDLTSGPLKDASGTDIAGGYSTVLSFLSQDPTVSWSPIWTDTTDGGKYGARDGDVFFADKSGGPGGRYGTGSMGPENSTTHGGWYVYAVVLDYRYTTFTGGSKTVPNGTDYAITTLPGASTAFQTTSYADSPAGNFNTFYGPSLQTQDGIQIVPEPMTIALMCSGLGLVLWRSRKKQ